VPSANIRMQQAALSSQEQLNTQQQDDLFSSSSQLPSGQGGFRFGNQNAVGHASQSNNVDEFPPLNRNANGEIGPDRGSSLMQNVGFGGQSNGLGFGSTNLPQTSRNNGLLNALSGSNRLAERVASPTSLSGRL
jgi:CCR4-NOT transcription complex subunit 2